MGVLVCQVRLLGSVVASHKGNSREKARVLVEKFGGFQVEKVRLQCATIEVWLI